MLSTTADVRAWLRDNAVAIDSSDPDAPGAELDTLIARLGAAGVVGLGESTRFSRQTFGVRERIFRGLVERHGFRALAIQDSARSGERWDRFVTTGESDPETVLAGAWRPWRTEESVATLRWIRGYNLAHPEDPVRIFGVEPPHAEPSDYDAVLDYVRRAAPDRFAAIEAHLAPIRTAHQVDEHVQRHQGIHPGRPFAEHAEDALTLLAQLPDTKERATAFTHARLILDFHRHSVAGQGFARDERPSAETVLRWRRSTGAKIVYWDGLAHTTNLPIVYDTAEFRGAGSHLRTGLGDGYLSVGIGFHHGDLGMAVAPGPQPDLVDAALGEVDLPAYYVDLRAEAPEPVRDWLDGPAELRTISGVYDPAADATAKVRLTSLADAFDVLIHVRETTPVHWLSQVSA
ncbi:erythromycin esterase family protein [Nocardia abscessus]|uniref:erythromycin esterase family protein n=1 Tax=Nocardia abscessus TaxID=120957 RepID=UPI000310B08C|nr:erythromycin esterase family protein [Nocardia abscessus]MCC3327559.1 erythromycin esterase family protein [Nocardia abscessus]